jgi:hypothetical protein
MNEVRKDNNEKKLCSFESITIVKNIIIIINRTLL